jgi:hypothetical protein
MRYFFLENNLELVRTNNCVQDPFSYNKQKTFLLLNFFTLAGYCSLIIFCRLRLWKLLIAHVLFFFENVIFFFLNLGPPFLLSGLYH